MPPTSSGICSATTNTFGSGVGDFKDGYTSGNLAKMVEKGVLDMDDLVELWKSPLIPNGPVVVRSSMDADMKTKFKEFMLGLPKSDPDCFSAIQGGDFTGFTEVTPEFYQPIIDAPGMCGKSGQSVPSSGGCHAFLVIDSHPDPLTALGRHEVAGLLDGLRTVHVGRTGEAAAAPGRVHERT